VFSDSSNTHENHEAWLVNLGASFHMTPHREWFCEYERYDGGDVFLGYELIAKIVGQGNIKLKLMYDLIRTLPSVLYIPILARNFICVSNMDDASVKIVFEKEIYRMV